MKGEQFGIFFGEFICDSFTGELEESCPASGKTYQARREVFSSKASKEEKSLWRAVFSIPDIKISEKTVDGRYVSIEPWSHDNNNQEISLGIPFGNVKELQIAGEKVSMLTFSSGGNRPSTCIAVFTNFPHHPTFKDKLLIGPTFEIEQNGGVIEQVSDYREGEPMASPSGIEVKKYTLSKSLKWEERP